MISAIAGPGRELLARQAVRRYPFHGDPTLRFVRAGENLTYSVETDGRRYALRIQTPKPDHPQAIASELAWLEELRGEAALRVPRALPGSDGELVQLVQRSDILHAVTLFEWEQGIPLGDAGDAAAWFCLGEAMARIHQRARSWTPPSWFDRPSWDEDGLLGSKAHWGNPRALTGWTTEGDALLAAAEEAVRRRLLALGRSSQRYGLIHADLSFANVLMRGDGRLCLLDFDDCGCGWIGYDLAVSLFPLERRTVKERQTLRGALLAGYRSVAPLDERTAAELPTFLTARRLATVAWILRNSHTEHAARERAWRLETLMPALESFLAWSAECPR